MHFRRHGHLNYVLNEFIPDDLIKILNSVPREVFSGDPYFVGKMLSDCQQKVATLILATRFTNMTIKQQL